MNANTREFSMSYVNQAAHHKSERFEVYNLFIFSILFAFIRGLSVYGMETDKRTKYWLAGSGTLMKRAATFSVPFP
jgi:hypothetical protein